MATDSTLFSNIGQWVTAGPRWLLGKVTKAFLFALVIPLDAIVQWLFEGMRARFPGVGPVECDPFVSRNAGIYQGRVEPRANWVARATQWLTTWRRAGSPFSILEGLAGFFGPNPPPLYIVDDTGNWYARMPPGVAAPAGMVGTGPEFILPVATRIAGVSGWHWDSYTGTGWSRFWVIADMTSGPYTHPNKWGGGGIWGTSGWTWGSSAGHADIQAIRDLILRFKPSASRCVYMIFDFTGHFQPNGSGSGYPDGTWAQWANRWQPAAYVSVP